MTKPAYMVISIDLHKPEGMPVYAAGTAPVLDRFEARVLAANNRIQVEDGTWPRNRIAIIEFPSLAAAREFWNSPDYAPLKPMREAISESDIILAEGPSEERAPHEDGRSHYLLGAATVDDPGWIEQYMQKVPPVAAKFGVRALVSGPQFEVLEGAWPHESAVLLSFPSEQVFKDFWHGEDYRPMKELREANSRGDHISFPGIMEVE